MQRIWLMLVTIGLVVLCVQFMRAVNAQRLQSSKIAPLRTVPKLSRTSSSAPAVGREAGAPAKGVTGTIALPTTRPFVDPGIIQHSDVAARPFALNTTSIVDRRRAVQCLAAAIYYEAASETEAGQRAVAQVVLNRVRHPAFPATVCGVVYQGSAHSGCQFSFACDGAIARLPTHTAWRQAVQIAGMALAGYVYAPIGLATHYHTYAATPAWNRSLVLTHMIGAHLFHRWKGYWGTEAAFVQKYNGREPAPGPIIAIPANPSVPDTSEFGAFEPASQRVRLATAPKSLATLGVHDNLPPEPQILDRWKNSGQLIVPQ